MYTFVFVHAPEQPRTEADLRAYARTLRQTMPALGLDLTADCAALTDCNCGWFLLQPDGTALPSLVSQAVEETHAVIAYGQVEGAPAAAHAVLDAWRRGGAQAVRELEGVFGAVVVDRREGAVTLISDAVGQRSLYYHAGGGALIVSPHDLALLSTGDCPARFDLTSAAGIAAAGWSFGGRSLLKEVSYCHPAGFVQRRDGRITWVSTPVLEPASRIEKGDRKAIALQFERMFERLRNSAKTFAGDAPTVYTDLTGGFDSRAVLALLLSAVAPSRIQAVCSGDSESPDVRIAASVAGRYGIPLERQVPELVSTDAYLSNTDLRAFAMNGATNSKRSIGPAPRFENETRPHAWGGAGEMYRRSYYHAFPKRLPLTHQEALDILKKKSRIEMLSRQRPELARSVAARFNQSVDNCASVSPDGYDIMDLFMLYERTAVWGAMSKRFDWLNRGLWCPYLSPQLVRDAYRMPSPLGDHTPIHEVLLRRYMPRAFWTPINGKTLAPLKWWARTMPLFHYVDRACHGLIMRVQPAYRGGRNTDQIRGDYFAGMLSGVLRETLTEADSLTIELFGREGIERLLEEHVSGRQNHTHTLGNLMTVERWRLMAQAMARQASIESPQIVPIHEPV